MRIEITGIIGSGKSSLAKLFLEEDFGVVLEEFKQNPFWKAFYTNPGKYNFETEVTFLFQHYHDLKRKLEEENKVVCDYSFTQDLAYAVMGLNPNQLEIFNSIYQYISDEVGYPKLIVHMKCSPEESLNRIIQRGRNEEKLIGIEFLGRLNNFLEIELENISKRASTPIYIVDTEKINIITGIEERKSLMQEIKTLI